MRRAISLLAAAVLLLGAATYHDVNRGSGVAGNDPNYRPFHEAGDGEMQAAIARARASTGELLRRLEQPPTSQTFLAIKVRLEDGRRAEHVWLDSVRYEGRRLYGLLNHDPKIVESARRGDLVQVTPGAITDWMAIDGGRLCGGYTVRVDWSRLSADERAALERDPRVVRVPMDTSGCAIEQPE